jgi:aromatic-L-amino-acid decarboxylase
MDSKEFRKYAHQVADWMADFSEKIEERPVKSLVKPGETFRMLLPRKVRVWKL